LPRARSWRCCSAARLGSALGIIGYVHIGRRLGEVALALDSGHLGGCARDVGRASDQMPSPALAMHPKVIATPHIGGLTRPAVEHQALQTVAQLAALLRGKMPSGAVNAARATRLAHWRELERSKGPP
jgi:D-3-phosphoglycerate dehydrogenase